MDHIPRLKKPFWPDVQIPYVVKDLHRYVPGQFKEFPQKHGFNLNSLKLGDFGDKTWDDAISFVQAWAYFGMQAEILRIGGVDTDFLPCEYLSTKQLPDLLKQLYVYNYDKVDAIKRERTIASLNVISRVKLFVSEVQAQEMSVPGGVAYSSPGNLLEEDLEELETCNDRGIILSCTGNQSSIWVTERHWNTHPNFFAAETGWDRNRGGRVESIGLRVFLAISLVGEYLELALGVIYGYSSYTEYPWQEPLMMSLRLTGAGWCSWEIKNLSKRLSLTCRYYLSSMDRRCLGKDHRACCHSRCLAN